MPRLSLLILIFLCTFFSAFAQSKTNADIGRELKRLGVDKSITVSFDGNSSKVMAIADNFADKDATRTGAQAINFALGFFYPGEKLDQAPDPVMFTFWILSKKPKFAAIQNVTFNVDGEAIAVNEIRYAGKAREDVEYLNMKLSRADLAKIAGGRDVTARIGSSDLKFSPEQLRVISGLLAVSSLE